MPKDLMNFYLWYILCNAEQKPEDDYDIDDSEDEDYVWEDLYYDDDEDIAIE
jgi:hypothetical protein